MQALNPANDLSAQKSKRVWLYEFLQDMQHIKTVEALNLRFDAVMKKFCFSHYAYQNKNVFNPGTRAPLIVSTYPDAWVQYYVSQSYSDIDPLVQLSGREFTPFTWDFLWQGRDASHKQKQLLSEAKEFSLNVGIGIPVVGIGGACALMTLASGSDTAHGVKKLLDENEELLHLLTTYYHMALRDLIAGQDNATLSQAAIDVTLTRREAEVLKWAYEGKSFEDIGSILGISRHSVDTYFRKIKSKLHVYSKQDAVIKAMRYNLICVG